MAQFDMNAYLSQCSHCHTKLAPNALVCIKCGEPTPRSIHTPGRKIGRLFAWLFLLGGIAGVITQFGTDYAVQWGGAAIMSLVVLVILYKK